MHLLLRCPLLIWYWRYISEGKYKVVQIKNNPAVLMFIDVFVYSSIYSLIHSFDSLVVNPFIHLVCALTHSGKQSVSTHYCVWFSTFVQFLADVRIFDLLSDFVRRWPVWRRRTMMTPCSPPRCRCPSVTWCETRASTSTSAANWQDTTNRYILM